MVGNYHRPFIDRFQRTLLNKLCTLILIGIVAPQYAALCRRAEHEAKSAVSFHDGRVADFKGREPLLIRRSTTAPSPSAVNFIS